MSKSRILKITPISSSSSWGRQIDLVAREYVPGGPYSKPPGIYYAARIQPTRNFVQTGPSAAWHIFKTEAEARLWIKENDHE